MHMDEKKVYINPGDENGAALFRRQIPGNVVMLNLLRFRPIADYTEFPQLAPIEDISGWDMALLIRQSSVDSFIAFATDQEYLKGMGHRVAAVADSRIVPLEDVG